MHFRDRGCLRTLRHLFVYATENTAVTISRRLVYIYLIAYYYTVDWML